MQSLHTTQMPKQVFTKNKLHNIKVTIYNCKMSLNTIYSLHVRCSRTRVKHELKIIQSHIPQISLKHTDRHTLVTEIKVSRQTYTHTFSQNVHK